MEYIIQENVFREQHYDHLNQALERLGLSYTTVRMFPFVDKIVDLKQIPNTSYNVDDLPEYQTKSNNVFVFGALKLARVAVENVEPEAIEYAQKMVNIFQLADAFVIDTCLTEDGWKIVECGCINCAGFYKSDLQKTIVALENKFNI